MVELDHRRARQHVPKRDLADLLGDTALAVLKPSATILKAGTKKFTNRKGDAGHDAKSSKNK